MNKKIIVSRVLTIFCFFIIGQNCFAPRLTPENLKQFDGGKKPTGSFSSFDGSSVYTGSVGYSSDSSRSSSGSITSKYDPHAPVGYRDTQKIGSPTSSTQTNPSRWNSSVSGTSPSSKVPRPRYDVAFVKPLEGLGKKLDPETVNRAISYEKSLEDYRARESARRLVEDDQIAVLEETKPQLSAAPLDSDPTYYERTQRRNPLSVPLYDDLYTSFKPKVEPPTKDEMQRAIIDGLTSGKIKIQDLSGEDLALATELLQTNLLNKQRERTREVVDIGLGAFGKPSPKFGD